MGRKTFLKAILIVFMLFWFGSNAIAGNIDPEADDHKYAWGENFGWINFNPSSGPGVTVTDTNVIGDAWGENIGWIRMNPVFGGISNDGSGNLTGYAWGENVGWISFSCENTNNCASVDYGVLIDPNTGLFSGKAWGENVGWISFDYNYSDTHGVKTSWGAIETCDGDFGIPDGNVDGSDLVVLINNTSLEDLETFAGNFGRTDCMDY